jgi:hypothetical protein
MCIGSAVIGHLECEDLQMRKRNASDLSWTNALVEREESEVPYVRPSMPYEPSQQPKTLEIGVAAGALFQYHAHRVSMIPGKVKCGPVVDKHMLYDPQLWRDAVEHAHESGDYIGGGDGYGPEAMLHNDGLHMPLDETEGARSTTTICARKRED